jgi:fimbrial chaperone protein
MRVSLDRTIDLSSGTGAVHAFSESKNGVKLALNHKVSAQPQFQGNETRTRTETTRRALIAGSGALSVACLGAPTLLRAMGVQPALLDLGVNARTMSAPLTVSNSFADPLPVELRLQEARFPSDADGQIAYSPTEDLLITPPTAVIAPARSQSFRLLYVGSPALETSRHFVITVAQLPVALPEGVNTVQLLYNFKVIVSIGVPGGKAALEVRTASLRQDPPPPANPASATPASAPAPYIEAIVANTSTSHGYLSDHRLRISQFDDTGKRVFQTTLSEAAVRQQVGLGLIAGGQVRRVRIPVQLPGSTGTVQVEVLGNAPRR